MATTTEVARPEFHLRSAEARGRCWEVFPGDSGEAMAAGFTAYAPMEHCTKRAGHVDAGDPDHTWGRLEEHTP
jgi:hypothetical protein